MMNRLALMAGLTLSACSSQQIYDSTSDMREQHCKDNFPSTDPLYDSCMREAQLSQEESLSRLQQRPEAAPH
ncbi:MAG: hypothetical protein ACSHXK_00980 [Oceanococcus sp.]